MPPGMPWAYGQSMSMRNPMSRAPMNNNPMGVQAPMTPNYGAASGAAATFRPLPYAGRALGVAGPASAVGGMMAGQSAMSRPAPRPQSTPYMRAMSGDPIYGQNGIGVQRAAQNVLMGQPMDADTRMRGLNMPGMQFNPSRGAMVQNQRTPLMVNPDQQRWGRLSAPGLSGRNLNTPNMAESAQRQMIDGATQRANTRIARAGRMAGVRAGDMAQWRATSPAALAIARNAMPQLQQPGPPDKVPAQMGEQMAGPPRPPAAVAPAAVATAEQTVPASQQTALAQLTPRDIAMNAPPTDPQRLSYLIESGRAMRRPPKGQTVVNPIEEQYRQQRDAVFQNQTYEDTFNPASLAESYTRGLRDNLNSVGSYVRDTYHNWLYGSPTQQSPQYGPNATTGQYVSPQSWRSRQGR